MRYDRNILIPDFYNIPKEFGDIVLVDCHEPFLPRATLMLFTFMLRTNEYEAAK